MTAPQIFHLMLFNGSRKVGFSLWLFATATALLVISLITSEQWMICVAATSTLIGGGTLADTWLSKKVDHNAPPAAPQV